MKTRVMAIAAAVMFCAGSAFAQEKAKVPMPIFVTPYYNSEGLKIEVGEHSKALAEPDAKSIAALSDKLKKEMATLRPEVMFVLAIRLYDLGLKDEAVYWFYTAQFRARVFVAILDAPAVKMGSRPFELRAAYSAFQQLVGEYANGYGFGDVPKIVKTLEQVAQESALPKFAEMYPDIKFVAPERWQAMNDETVKGITNLANYIKENEAMIKKERKKKGVEGKY
jgi:hypothetical protein